MFTNELIKKAHENAVAHGFWDSAPTFSESCALIHSEISESFEEWRNNRPNEYTGENGKPEGVWVELADVVLRVADLLGYIETMISTKDDTFTKLYGDVLEAMRNIKGSFGEFIDYLHMLVAEASKENDADSDDGTVFTFVYLLMNVYAKAEVDGIDLDGIVERKHAYNVTRPYRHGNKRL